MSLTIKTVRLLQRLLDGEIVNAGEFASVQQKELVAFLLHWRGITFKGVGKSRGRYFVADKALFQEICSQYDPVLKDLEAAARLASGEVKTRSEKVALFGNSKQDGANKSIKGFTILADREIAIGYLGREYLINSLTGLHIVAWHSIILPPEATVVIVENAECLYDLRWIPNVGLKVKDGPFVILCRFPVCEEAKRWLETVPNRILYFGDFDLAGIRIYENEFKKRLGDKISFIVPDDLEKRIRKKGNTELYAKQVNEGFASVSCQSSELKDLIALLHNLQSSYEQEGYCVS